MKKLTALVLTLVLAFSLSTTAFAAEIDQDSEPKSTDVTVTTSIEPTYTVTIPADIKINFNETSTSFGSIKLDAAQLDPGYAVKVALSASGTLKNKADANKTIAYTIKDGNGTFTSAEYLTAGSSTALTIDITQAAWDSAYAGEYSETVTFTVSYVETGVTP